MDDFDEKFILGYAVASRLSADEKIKYITDGLSKCSESVKVLMLPSLGIAYNQAERYNEARETFINAIKSYTVDNESLDTYEHLGYSYHKLGNVKLAIWAYEKALNGGKRGFCSDSNYSNLGVNYMKDNRIQDAIKIFEKGVERGCDIAHVNLEIAKLKLSPTTNIPSEEVMHAMLEIWKIKNGKK